MVRFRVVGLSGGVLRSCGFLWAVGSFRFAMILGWMKGFLGNSCGMAIRDVINGKTVNYSNNSSII